MRGVPRDTARLFLLLPTSKPIFHDIKSYIVRPDMNAISSEVGRGLLYILDAEPARAGVGVSLRVAFVGVAAAGEVPNAAMMRLAMLAIEGAAVTEGVLMWPSGLIFTSTWNGDSLGGPGSPCAVKLGRSVVGCRVPAAPVSNVCEIPSTTRTCIPMETVWPEQVV